MNDTTPEKTKLSWWRRLSGGLKGTSNSLGSAVADLVTKRKLDRAMLDDIEDVLLRAADVALKEKRKLILVPRETPLNLVHVRNYELLLLAGAIILPANPSFYHCPATIEQVIDTVVGRVLDHLGIAHTLSPRWQEENQLE